jgi:serine/threonine protein kinase
MRCKARAADEITAIHQRIPKSVPMRLKRNVTLRHSITPVVGSLGGETVAIVRNAGAKPARSHNDATTLQSTLHPGSQVASLGPMPTTPIDPSAKGDAHAGTRLAGVERHTAPPSGRYVPGSLLSGKYQLDELLGEGGMGSVWRATNLLLGLPVALKLIRADLDRGALRARLQLEARSAAKLGHPAIVRVFDVGESEFGDPFIVMELLQGETMASMLTRGRMSGAQAVQLLLPIIDALGMAHARGIVHRDLKPDNVMIALEDQHVQPKILDFGIAKLTDPRDSDHKLTEAGTVVGSPDYMSPEQARGSDDVDASTDIWSICVVLYESVTGCPPFGASNYNALLRAIVEDQPQSIVACAAGDEALWTIIQRGLAKDRRHRHATMNELGQALAAWLLSHGVREDASGASIESKWLGRSSDSAGLAPRSGSASTIRQDFRSKPTLDSHPGLTGVGRGPFTATIEPHTSGRKRAFGALALVAALIALSVFALGSRSKSPIAANAHALAAPQRPGVPAAITTEPPAPAPPLAVPTGAVTPLVLSAAPASPSAAPSSSTLRKPTARVNPSQASAPAAPAGHPAIAKASLAPAIPAAQPSGKTSERPLDLLAPY